MKKIFKWIGIVLGTLVGLLLVAGVVLYVIGSSRLNKVYDIPDSGIVAPTDAQSIERGKHIAETSCVGCHGADLSGVADFINIEGIAHADSANLTAGEGGLGGVYSDEDFVRAIRHGVSKDGTGNFMPPVPFFQYMSDEDLAAVIAYIRTMPPVDHQTRSFQAKPLGYVLFGAGLFGNLPAEDVTHQNNVSAPEPGITAEYGEYRMRISGCQDCHGIDLAGGSYPDPTITYVVPNLTPGGDLGNWTEEQFLQTIRTQKTPDGKGLNSNLMPFDEVNRLTDDELKAIFAYLKTVPAFPQNTK